MTDSWLEPFLSTRPHLREHVDLLQYPPLYGEVCNEFPDAAGESDLEDAERRFVRDNHDKQGHGLTVLSLYVITRRSGTGHRLATMLALQQPHAVETTDTFWAGRKRFDQVYGQEYAGNIRKRLAAQGVTLGNKEYFPELAKFPGDPEAVMGFDDIRGNIRKLAEKRGHAVNGMVTVQHREPERDPHSPETRPRLAPSLAIQQAKKMATENPDLRRKTKRELVEMVIDKHGESTI